MRTHRPASSLIDRLVYDDAAHTLLVTFRAGRRYLYRDVPPSIYDALVAAPSAGRYFNAEVRDRFDGAAADGRRRYPLDERAA
ncbi:KTSC domain-containing protein [Sphingomonas yunnanensis]|uniref:KTSC domain-containing protein n=1 Tax=Sphingomonas yunnanensis TaxID=310400 RepID=UPI001CA6760A|nr:KTSC domain-containing protein [Sphingomonas yunnanensis]MBY9062162.1 KTSC domain-containing protein [Sphingomonas yunnanensis]